MQILYQVMKWKPHSCIDIEVHSIYLTVFICPSHIANWMQKALGMIDIQLDHWDISIADQ